MLRRFSPVILTALLLMLRTSFALDLNGNGLDDVWEIIYNAATLLPAADTDGDGFSNGQESAAGTDPFDRNSRPQLQPMRWSATQFQLGFSEVAGKRYQIESKANLLAPAWTGDFTEIAPAAAAVTLLYETTASRSFWRLLVDDVDSDNDGLNDFDERALGFDPNRDRTDRNDQTDLQRVTAMLNATNTVTLGVLSDRMSERWPSPGVFVIRRSGGLRPITVNIAFGGTATPGADFTTTINGVAASSPPVTVVIPMGVREVPILFDPVADSDDSEPAETITATLLPGSNYSLGTATSGTITLDNETAASLPGAKAAARFLIQAAFGPDQSSPDDAEDAPTNLQQVMTLGYEGWIDDQFTRPVGLIQPWVEWAFANAGPLSLWGNWKSFSWWNRVMGVPKLHPGLGPSAPDPLRQRVAFALSEILVASDRPEQLGAEQLGMANFYDLFERHAFGNYRKLLLEVALHPVMGLYLSHLGNQKPNPVTHTYPDENFAREVMQLFSIGLWKLNLDGTRQLDPNGQPIPTYNNNDITEMARVFTGLSFGNNANFTLYPRDCAQPMKGWDAYHDCDPKTLIGGVQLPARTPSPGNTGAATMADVSAAIDVIFQHQNVGPFLAYRLIQRFVTSNPSPAYIGRVAAKFNDNGAGERGDMRAVIKAVLLDPEARDPAMISRPDWGKMREPILQVANVAHALRGKALAGYYTLDQFALAFLQDPMNSPSVFNFFLPAYSPAGAITLAGLVAPEFQIVNTSTAVASANYFWTHINSDLQYWGSSDPAKAVRLNLKTELAYLVAPDHIDDNVPPPLADMDTDALLRRLDLVLTAGNLTPQNYQIIREAMLRIGTSTWQWHRERLRIAIYLITTSPDFVILR